MGIIKEGSRKEDKSRPQGEVACSGGLQKTSEWMTECLGIALCQHRKGRKNVHKEEQRTPWNPGVDGPSTGGEM